MSHDYNPERWIVVASIAMLLAIGVPASIGVWRKLSGQTCASPSSTRIGKIGGWDNGPGDIAAVIARQNGYIHVRMTDGREVIMLTGYIVLDAKESAQ